MPLSEIAAANIAAANIAAANIAAANIAAAQATAVGFTVSGPDARNGTGEANAGLATAKEISSCGSRRLFLFLKLLR